MVRDAFECQARVSCWFLPIRECFKFGKMGSWNRLMTGRLRAKKCFKFVSSSFKFVLEVSGMSAVAFTRMQQQEMPGKTGKIMALLRTLGTRLDYDKVQS